MLEWAVSMVPAPCREIETTHWSHLPSSIEWKRSVNAQSFSKWSKALRA